MKAVLESEQQRLDTFCMVIESHLNGKTAGDKPGLESSDYEMIDMRRHSRQSESAQERQRYKDALKELYSFTFVIEDEGEEEVYPVGKFGVAHPRSPEIPLVLDWRSEVAMRASMFNGETIETPGGDIVGMTQLELDRRQRRVIQANHRRAPKRQSSSLTKRFTEQIKSTFKKPETVPEVPEESFMEQELTKKQKDRSIDGFIATRQAEQNHIIQAPVNTYMIVQGAAGTGKSLTALHRMSYLQYQDERRKMLYLAPNEATIHQLLKDAEHLQIQSVSTMTFDDFAVQLNKKFLNQNGHLELLPLYESSHLIKWVDEALAEWNEDICETLFSYEPIHELVNLHERAIDIWMSGKGTFHEKRLRILQTIRSELEKIHILNKQDYEQEYIETASTWTKYLYDEKRQKLSELMKESFENRLLSEKKKREAFLNFWSDILRIDAETVWKMLKNPLMLDHMKVDVDETLLKAWHKYKSPTRLDLFLWMYLHYETNGYPEKWSHLFVDEAQTLRPLDLMVLEKICHGMTVFGDTLQSYQELDMESWDAIQTNGTSKWHIEYLTKAFRTTKPIINFAKEILYDSDHDTTWIDPFNRDGQPIEFLVTKKSREIKDVLARWREQQFTICIITPTLERAQFLHAKLNLRTQIILSDTTKVGDEIVISTVDYLRGMEFDAVLLMDVDQDSYPEFPQEARRLYVSLTRALHEVVVHTTEEYSSLFRSIVFNNRKRKQVQI
ncbi:3'-5' exonuclease [Exiguobacterium sp. s194]|uniref:3'-5' exonuclease n=1 Tax=Exiguobacterium sp. s194 TaxID=2751230 RepID=UPI001BEA99F4|nr:3'-5' exonuclease [Exiguobacterium sp. s194]